MFLSEVTQAGTVMHSLPEKNDGVGWPRSKPDLHFVFSYLLYGAVAVYFSPAGYLIVNEDVFCRLVSRVMERLPGPFQEHLDNVVVDVQRWPEEGLLHLAGFSHEEIEGGETLFGLFVPLETGHLWGDDAIDPVHAPHKLILFQGPLEEAFPDPKILRIEIRKTVIHELAHHFGWTDRDLESFDNRDDPFPDDIFEDM